MALVVLLRGVNVGGHRTLRPAALAQELKHLDVVNIGAAGTFVVRRRIARTQLRAEFARRLPFEAEIMICEGRDVVALLSQEHFAGHAARADVVRFVSVLSRLPPNAPSLPMSLPPGAPWLVKVLTRVGRLIVGVYRRDIKAIGCLGTLERVLGVPVTTRNWNTIGAIARVLERPPAS